MQNLVDTCSELLGASACGVLLADRSGNLDLVVSTSEASRLVEVMQLSAAAHWTPGRYPAVLGPGIQ